MTRHESKRYRVGVDVGGTFTDIVLLEEASGDILTAKVPTVPGDPSEGCMNGVNMALDKDGIDANAVAFLVHGTTIATNTIIQGKGATAALVTTEGFRDLLEIAYQTRPNLYDLNFRRPSPLIPRHLCFAVPERVMADGTVRRPLDEAAVREVAARLRTENVEAVAVSFLHAYKFPAHERRAGEILAEELDGIPIVLSSDVSREFREYPRTSTTVVNAVLLPRVRPYLARLEDRLSERGIGAGLHLMTSAGGIATAEVAKRLPVQLVESGPAAGVIGAAYIAQMSGHRNLLALDIGGTTAKAALVNDGQPLIAEQFEVGSSAMASLTAPKGQGYPVVTPVVSLVEIGAGGGSIAYLDPGGALTVGPESAGADPGPVCYAQGGTEPTITDANVVLGRIDPDYFLGGAAKLDADLAHKAIAAKIAGPLGLDVVQAARAIIEIADAKMTGALHFVSVEQGIDPRDYIMVPSGGAGPMHAVAIARALGVKSVLVPPTPGLNSAVGLLVSDLKHEAVRTVMQVTEKTNIAALRATILEMEDGLRALLREEDVDDADVTTGREFDMCYVGQSFRLRIPWEDDTIDASFAERIAKRFHAQHASVYGFANPGAETSLINVRVTGTGRVERPSMRVLARSDRPVEEAIKGCRRVFFSEGEAFDAAIYDRGRLLAGDRFAGPAIVEQMDTTVVVHPGASVEVDDNGNLAVATGV
jgi:N-methylhydantoinase A